MFTEPTHLADAVRIAKAEFLSAINNGQPLSWASVDRALAKLYAARRALNAAKHATAQEQAQQRGWATRLTGEGRHLVVALLKCSLATLRENVDDLEYALGLNARDWSGEQECDIDLTTQERDALDAYDGRQQETPKPSALSDAQLVERAVIRVWRDREPARRVSHVMSAFGLGSGSAAALCRRFGLNPDEIVGGEPIGDYAAEE